MAVIAAALTWMLPPAAHHGEEVTVGRVAQCQVVDMDRGHVSAWHWHCRPERAR